MMSKKFSVSSILFALGCLLVIPVAASDRGEKSPAVIRVDLGDFSIDATEVSVGQFSDYAAKRNITTAAEREGGGFEYGSGWERRPGWIYKTPFGERAGSGEPAVHLTWFEAKAYCEDAGGS